MKIAMLSVMVMLLMVSAVSATGYGYNDKSDICKYLGAYAKYVSYCKNDNDHDKDYDHDDDDKCSKHSKYIGGYGKKYNDCDNDTHEVPEFSTVASALAFAGAGAGFFLLRKRN